MELSLDQTRELFNKGHFATIAHAVGPKPIPRLRVEAAALRTVVAHACAYVGRLGLANELAESVITERASPPDQSDARIVLGLIRKRHGDFAGACTEFQQAARLAEDSHDRRRLAWAQVHLFRVLSDGHPEPLLSALIASVRRAVSNAGDAHAAAYLHEAVAIMEAQKGRCDEAARHLEIARNLLKSHPSAWLEQLVAVNASTLALITREGKNFARHVAEARSLERFTGHAKCNAAMDANDAYFALISGRFDRAAALLKHLLGNSVSLNVELGALETLARLHLANGRLLECHESLARLESLKSEQLAESYVFRTAAILNVKLMIRNHQEAQAAEYAKKQSASFAMVSDNTSLAALQMLRALALREIGSNVECSKEIVAASLAGANSLREYQAEYSYICGQILANAGYRAHATFARRSLQIWHEQQDSCGPLEAATASGVRIETEVEAKRVSAAFRRSVTARVPRESNREFVINHLSAAFDLAYSPRLLGDELLQAITQCELSPEVRIVPLRPGATSNQNVCVLPLGLNETSTLALQCRFPDDAAKAILLSDVLRIGKAALALERAKQEERNRAAIWPAETVEEQDGALFLSEEMRELLATARRIAPTNVPVLITGETGTGKEVLARTIHAYSPRARAAFLPFNCTSTPRDMLDSQLFGHRRGAFTGAVDAFPGVIRSATGGTLFLDEIGDMSLELQPKLLRFLESNEVHPVGDPRPVPVDVRVIVATNADLDTMVGDGRFREDLFYRLNIVRLRIPPLRERRVEIPPLASHYLRKYAEEYGKGELRLAEETIEYLVLYRWPGNVRQLANEMRRLAALAEPGAVLMPEHLSPEIAASRRTVPASARTLETTEIVVRIDQPMAAAVNHLERAMVQYALKKCEGHMEETAALLGLSRKGLYLKRQRLGIELPVERSSSSGVA